MLKEILGLDEGKTVNMYADPNNRLYKIPGTSHTGFIMQTDYLLTNNSVSGWNQMMIKDTRCQNYDRKIPVTNIHIPYFISFLSTEC